jgi:hypothetical protein
MTPCDSNDQAAQKVLYAMTNTVKDGITPNVEHSPLFNTYALQALGKQQRYFDFDFRGYHAAGGKSNQKLRFKDFMEWKTLEIAPLPGFVDMDPEELQAYWREQVAAVEQNKAEELKSQGRSFMAVSRLMNLDPNDRPEEPRADTGPQPLVHADTPEAAEAYKKKYNEVRKQHKVASIAYLQGDFSVEFPLGTFRPPLIQVIDTS